MVLGLLGGSGAKRGSRSASMKRMGLGEGEGWASDGGGREKTDRWRRGRCGGRKGLLGKSGEESGEDSPSGEVWGLVERGGVVLHGGWGCWVRGEGGGRGLFFPLDPRGGP
uniref:Uncharacterized protein n=1 Tax=Knipowitschia caucasica TaxID=637954 RepID=A0AAV2MJT9_KNICA